MHSGDSIRFEVYGRYDVGKKAVIWPVIIPLAATNSAPTTTLTSDNASPSTRGLLPKLATGITLMWTAIPHLFQHQVVVPRASIKYDFYDKDSTLVASEVKYLEHDAANAWQKLEVGLKAPQDGYVLVSMQNASVQDVWFDDASLRSTTTELIVQENHYDPWGQNLVDIEVAGAPDCKQQYSNKQRIDDAGLEWVDHGARYYDTQLGRWHTPDPADQFSSPYVGMGNNPVMYTDPDGRFIFIPILIGAAVGGIINLATHAHQIHNFRDGAVAFGIGAVAGGLAVFTGGAAVASVEALCIVSIGGGALAGAAGAAASSPFQGISNSMYFGDDYGPRQFVTDVAVGGAVSGLLGGFAGLRNNARWASKGLPRNSVLTGQELPASGADAVGSGIPDEIAAQFPQYKDLTPGGYYTYSNPGAVSAARGTGLNVTQRSLQHMFSRHAGDFGVTSNWNKAMSSQFEGILRSHIDGISPIQGTYRGTQPALHYFDPNTSLNVMTDMSGNLLGGWKLSPDQIRYLLSTGAVK